MQKKCSRCGKPIKEVGRLVRVTWLGFRAPLCKSCRKALKKEEKRAPVISRSFKRIKR